MPSIKKSARSYVSNLKKVLNSLDLNELEKTVGILSEAQDRDTTIYIIGNGGSASTSDHFASDLSKTVKGHKGNTPGKGFKAISLASNMPLVSAWANDTNYSNVFSRQIENLGNEGDVLIAISSSGASKNILKAVRSAHKKKMKVITISGFSGNELSGMGDANMVAGHDEYGPVEDFQLILDHVIVDYFFRANTE